MADNTQKDTRTEAEKLRDEQLANKPGMNENDAAFAEANAPVPDNAADNRNDRTARNPAAEGYGTPTLEELKAGKKQHNPDWKPGDK